MAKIINIIIDKTVVEFNSDTPDFEKLVQAIIDNRNYDFSKILVKCDDDNFDSDSFKTALTDTINSVLESLKINDDSFNNALKNLEKEEHQDNCVSVE